MTKYMQAALESINKAIKIVDEDVVDPAEKAVQFDRLSEMIQSAIAPLVLHQKNSQESLPAELLKNLENTHFICLDLAKKSRMGQQVSLKAEELVQSSLYASRGLIESTFGPDEASRLKLLRAAETARAACENPGASLDELEGLVSLLNAETYFSKITSFFEKEVTCNDAELAISPGKITHTQANQWSWRQAQRLAGVSNKTPEDIVQSIEKRMENPAELAAAISKKYNP